MRQGESSSQTLPAIVVVAFNRPASLARLLRSLAVAAQHEQDCPLLLVSLDGGGTEREACLSIVRAFSWPTEMKIIEHEKSLGLRDHILACGDLTQQYKSILVLEDDVCVSPASLLFARAAVKQYEDVTEIAGISLYSFIYNEFAKSPFEPVDDGSDVYFLQTASSWGQLWTRNQWAEFRNWLARGKSEAAIPIPKEVVSWSKDSSWKRAYNFYLADVGRYFVFPRHSFSTNMGEEGTHFPVRSTHLTSPLTVARKDISFGSLERSSARYDAFLEIEPNVLKTMAPQLRGYDFDVDLTGTKSLDWLKKPLTLTARQSPHPAILSFGFKHFPAELNIIFNEPGSVFGLRRRDGLNENPKLETTMLARNFFCFDDKNGVPRKSILNRLKSVFRN